MPHTDPPSSPGQEADGTAARIRVVAAVAAAVFRCASYEELGTVLVEASQRVVPHDAFAFGVYDAEGGVLRFPAAWDGEIFQSGVTVPIQGTPAEAVLKERRSHTTRSAEPDHGVRLFGTGKRSQSIIRVPVLSDDGAVAMISVQSYSPDAFNQQDVEVLEVFAAVTARAMQNIDLLQRQREMETALRASEQKFRTVVENLGEGICITDLDDRILYANRSLSVMTGYATEELAGAVVSEKLAAPEDRARVRAEHATRGAGSSSRYEIRYIRADGARIWVEVKGTPMYDTNGGVMGTVGVISDITRRKLAAEELHRRTDALVESEQRFRDVVDNISEVFWLKDGESGRLLYVSPGYEEIWGRPTQGLYADPGEWLVAVHEDDRLVVASASPRMKDGGYDVEYRVVRPDGSIRWVRDRAFPVSDENGRVVRIAGIAADVTDARTRDAQLNRAERLAAVGTLIGGVAHELNNPLQSIRGFADLLLEGAQTDEDREALATIAREARRAARIVSELRRVARSSHEETGPREPVDLNDVVRHVMKTQAYSLASANIFVTLDLARALPHISADPARVEQVMLNLLVNAAQALASRESGRRIIVRTRRTRAGCSLAVYDNGQGIESGHMPRLFDPFWTTKGPGEGTGLGLSVVHQIVTEHGGTVHVDSEPGRGTNFHVELPMGESGEPVAGGAAGAAAVRATTDTDAPKPRQLRILVVDDEEPLRRMLARIGTRRGHVVDTASEGREALEKVRAAEAERPYDIVFSDLHMPGVSGRQFTEQLLAHNASYEDRLFVFTGAMDTSDIAWIRERTSVPIMHKPFSISDVAAVLMDYEQRAALDEPRDEPDDGPDAAAQGPKPSAVD